jgi:hypothetical protein
MPRELFKDLVRNILRSLAYLIPLILWILIVTFHFSE